MKEVAHIQFSTNLFAYFFQIPETEQDKINGLVQFLHDNN